MYLKEIQHILNTIASTNHVIVFKKERWLNGYDYFFVYTFSSLVILLK